MIYYIKGPYILQGLWDKMSIEDKMKYGIKVEDKMDEEVIEIPSKVLRLWKDMLQYSQLTDKISYVKDGIDSQLKIHKEKLDLEKAFNTLIEGNSDCLKWLCKTEKEKIKDLIKILELNLNS